MQQLGDKEVQQLSMQLRHELNFDAPRATGFLLDGIPREAIFGRRGVARSVPGSANPQFLLAMDTLPFTPRDFEDDAKGLSEMINYLLRQPIHEAVKGGKPYTLDISTTEAVKSVPFTIRVYVAERGYLLVDAMRTETVLLDNLEKLVRDYSESELKDIVNAITCGNEAFGCTLKGVRKHGNYFCFGTCDFTYKCFWRTMTGLLYPPPVNVPCNYKAEFQAFLDEEVPKLSCRDEAESYYILSRLLYSCEVYKEYKWGNGIVYVLPRCQDMREIKLEIKEGKKIYKIAPQLEELDEDIHYCSARATEEPCGDDAEEEPSSKRARIASNLHPHVAASNLHPHVAEGKPKADSELMKTWLCENF